MKKYVKILLVLVALAALPLLYKFVLFDDEPFDNLRAGEIESAQLTRQYDDKKIEIKDISSFSDRLDDLELEYRVNEVHNDSTDGVKVSIYYRNGKSETVVISREYIQTDKGTFKADYESASEFLRYTDYLMK